MIIRLSKSLVVIAIALFTGLVVFGNITDYSTNSAFISHVFSMDTIFPDSTIKYRAVESPILQEIGYSFIILLELAASLFCWIGGIQMLLNLKKDTGVFNRKKNLAIIGLTIGFLIWQVGFMSIGGEWFGMWMSEKWNAVPTAFRISLIMLAGLIYLVQKEEQISENT